VGESIIHRIPWWRGWTPVVVLPAVVLALTPAEWPRWLFMWLLALAIYAGVKWLTWRRTWAPDAPAWRHVAYLLAWPRLDAAAFLNSSRPVNSPDIREWVGAVVKLLAGATLFWGVAPIVSEQAELLRGWIGMAGVVLMLHFGSLHLLSCAWRCAGVDARPLMQAPLRSKSLAEFWGRRWNTAFRDLTYRFLFRPLIARFGPTGALFAGFAFSGLVHDLVISVPAGARYGGPTCFFLIQAAALSMERSRFGQSVGLGRRECGRLFALLALALPVPLLFHAPFVHRVVVPFMEVLGALR
jgi:Membrane bound O-acyl transferase family